MTTNIAETKNTAPVSGELPKKATARAQKPRVTSTKGKAWKKATSAKKRPKAPKTAKSAKAARALPLAFTVRPRWDLAEVTPA